MAAIRTYSHIPAPHETGRACVEETWFEDLVIDAGGDTGILGEDYDQFSAIVAQIDVTAADGTTPTLDVQLQDSVDGALWNGVTSWAQFEAVGRGIIRVNLTVPFGRRLRLAWEVGGTDPTFTATATAILLG